MRVLRFDLFRRWGSAVGLAAAALVAIEAPARPAVFGPGVKQFAPVATSAAAPNRQALLVVPAFSGGGENPRGALAQSDAATYRDLLRLLGFSVTVIAADTRPGLDIAARGFASRVTREADVAVFILGAAIEVGTKIYVPASDLPAGERTRERIVTQGLDLAELLHRIVDRGPREAVAIVDECAGAEPGSPCKIGADTVPDNISAIIVHRVGRRDAQGPLAGVATIREDLLALMKEPDLSFLKLYGRLKDRLDGTNDGLATTPALSRSFAFLPIDFFEKLPTECNRIDAGTTADALRAMPSTAPQVTACENAAQTWNFAPFFKDKLDVAREQLAFQTAVKSCAPDAADAYLQRYPNGSYRFAVTEQKAKCERQNQPSPPAPEAPPAPATTPSLQDRATAAVSIYYDRHSLRGGFNRQGLAEIYPPSFNRFGGYVTRDQHLNDLARFYAPFSDFNPYAVPGTLDFDDCRTESSCLVRGSLETTKRKAGDTEYSSSHGRFSIRFDLRGGMQVTYECSRVDGQRGRASSCE